MAIFFAFAQIAMYCEFGERLIARFDKINNEQSNNMTGTYYQVVYRKSCQSFWAAHNNCFYLTSLEVLMVLVTLLKLYVIRVEIHSLNLDSIRIFFI